MSSEEETVQNEHSTLLTLPLFSGHHPIPPPSPEHLGTATPPPYTTSASIPFTWEEEPGKPRPPSSPPPLPPPPTRTTSNILEPPPGLPKTPSPNTVLDGPYNLLNSSTPKFISSSFRFLNEESVDSTGKKKLKRKRLLFPSWKQRNSRNGKKEMVGSSCRSFVFPATSEPDSATGCGHGFGFVETTSDKSGNFSRFCRNGSLHSVSPKPQFWASVYQGLKHAIPWKTSRKSRKDVLL